MRVLVTGGNGFIGRSLVLVLASAGHQVRTAVRANAVGVDRELKKGIEVAVVGDIGAATDWRAALAGVEGIVHLAGRAHVMRDRAVDPLAEFRRVNVEGTRRLAAAAVAAGVRRFVFVSSVKVNGERTPDRPFTEADPPSPEDAYGLSKWEAEQALAESGLEVVLVRPPLVYGPGVKGNFLQLLRLCASGLPVPLGAVDNARSLIYVGNLASALERALTHPAAAGETFLVRDGEDLSVPQLARRMGDALGRRVRLVPVPPTLLRWSAAMVGRPGLAARLLDPLIVDDRHLRQTLDWRPPASVDEGLRQTVDWYRRQAS